MSSVVLVTLAYNNVEEARKTLASVALQSVRPSRYIVVDSSGQAEAAEIRELATLAHAEYHWIVPRGVYPAMNYALGLLSDDDYVWFINSSDWLYGPESLADMEASAITGANWVVGGLQRLGDANFPFHPMPTESLAFLRELREGSIGFPHPSTIMGVRGIRQIRGFDETFRIAADYDLALRFSAIAKEPAIVSRIVSVHVPTGLTSKSKVRHYFEKVISRRKALVPNHSLAAEWKIFLRDLSGRLRGGGPRSQRREPQSATPSFGKELNLWPRNELERVSED